MLPVGFGKLRILFESAKEDVRYLLISLPVLGRLGNYSAEYAWLFLAIFHEINCDSRFLFLPTSSYADYYFYQSYVVFIQRHLDVMASGIKSNGRGSVRLVLSYIIDWIIIM